MTEHQLAVRVTEVHSVALAPFPVLAVGAVVFPHPAPVTVGLEAMIPDIHKVILVDVALVVVRTDARAGRDRTVNQHGTDSNTGLAGNRNDPSHHPHKGRGSLRNHNWP